MAYVNFQLSYIRFKIVYYGPGLSGKTTNLEQLHRLSGGKTEMVSLETEGDRTIFFDYMPLNLGRLGGIETVFKLYTVPGQVRYNRTRQMVLRDVDGVIFVADSQLEAMPDNLESLRNLAENLAEEGVDIEDLPLVMQYNKRDLDNAAKTELLQEKLNPGGRRWLPASAIRAENVKETLGEVARQVYRRAAEQYGLPSSGSARSREFSDDLRERERSVGERAAREAETVPPPGPRRTRSSARVEKAADSPPPPSAIQSEALAEISLRLEELRSMVQRELESRPRRDAGADSTEKLLAESAKLRRTVEATRGAVLDLREQLASIREELRRELRSEVDRFLSDYLEEVEPGPQKQSEASPGDDARSSSPGSGLTRPWGAYAYRPKER